MQKIWLLGYNLGIMSIMLICMIPSCSFGQEIILEAKDVQFFKVVEVDSSTAQEIKLSGLAFHSSLAVRDMKVIQEKESLVIFVYLVPAKAGMSGNFEYTISIPSSVNTIRFGSERVIIWKRTKT